MTDDNDAILLSRGNTYLLEKSVNNERSLCHALSSVRTKRLSVLPLVASVVGRPRNWCHKTSDW